MAKGIDQTVIDALKEYCNERHYDYDKLMAMPKSYGEGVFLIYHFDPKRGENGLYDETPMPVVLRLTRRDSEWTVSETEYARMYLVRQAE